MFIAIAAFLLLLIFGLIVKNSRRALYSDFSTDADISEFEKQMQKLARNLTLPTPHGKGVDVQPVKKFINKAYHIIKRKLINGEELFEFERWLYDNHYVFKRLLDGGVFDTFFDLPHSGAAPRVVIFARTIVALSEGKTDKERVETALHAVNAVTPLTFSEVDNLKAALQFALIEKIASVSKKAVYYRKMSRIAVRAKNVAKKYINNNLYVYYTIKHNPKLSEALKDYMDANAKKYDNIDYTFSELIVENNVLTAALTTSLFNLDDAVKDRYKLMPAYKVLDSDITFENSDVATKLLYLKRVAVLSDKLNIPEDEFASKLLSYAENLKEHFGIPLFEGGKEVLKSVKAGKRIITAEKPKIAEEAYVALNAVITLLLSVAAGAASLSLGWGVAVSVLGTIGLIVPSYYLSNKIAALFVKPKPVCRMAHKNIPDYAQTEVIVPVYVTNANSLQKNVRHIETLALGNPFENLKFTLLVDFKAADAECIESDKELLDIIKKATDNGIIEAAVRKRTFNGVNYSGYERKRGAVEQYAEYLMTGKDDNFKVFGKHERPVYFIVLDADNTLSPQAVLRIVNTFLHPLNSRYDLLAFEGRVNLYSLKTLYSKRFLAEGGRENYPQYSAFYYNLTGNAVFQGKGIFKLEKYSQKLNHRLPENKILSHDLIEGALVDTGYAAECTYEDAPLTLGAEEDRRLRWTRGDIQLLPFINFPKNAESKGEISLFYRFLMYFNAFSVFYQPYVLMLFFVAIFAKLPYLAVFAACIYALEFVIDILCDLTSVAFEKRFLYFIKNSVRSFLCFVRRVVLLPYYAVSNLVLYFVTLFRMFVTKRGLLNWKPFAAGVSCAEVKKERISNNTKEQLLSYAADAYKYFESFTKDGLVADNYQSFPKGTTVNYTSPTNIGFSIIAEASAYKLGLKPFDAAEERVNEILTASLKLKKWNGHLYNWYDIVTKKPLAPSFVSSVDSANYIASLIVVSGIFGEKTQKIVNDYLKTVNFRALFDDEKRLFYIGYNSQLKTYEGHYDNVISEAQLLSYLGVCFGVPVTVWDSLTRDYTSSHGNTLLSWGGTAFEYLLPSLFIVPPKDGLLYKTTENAVDIMIKNKCHGLFGISESGYFELDDNKNFCYRAHGLDSLSLKSELNKCVISPYSSFLMLPYAPKKVLKNLNKLKKYEAYGDYGFYEAVDFAASPRIVLEYMAHHLGMTLAAITNYLTDDSLAAAVWQNEKVAAGAALLCDRVFEGKTVRPEKNKYVYGNSSNENYRLSVDANQAVPKSLILKCGDYRVYVDDFGRGFSKMRDIAVNRFSKDINENNGAFFYVTDMENLETSSPTRAPLGVKADYGIVFEKTAATYTNPEKGLTQTVYAPEFFCGELRKLKIENRADKPKSYRIAYYSELCLNTPDAFSSHPTFSNLFVETEVRDGVLYATRRGNENDGVYAALFVKGIACKYVSNRYNFLGRGNTATNPDGVVDFVPRSNDNGTVLDPCLAFIGDIIVNAGQSVEIEVFTAVSDSTEKLGTDIKRAKNVHFSELIKKIPYVIESNALYDLDGFYTDYLSALVPEIIFKPYDNQKLLQVCREHKLFMHLSGNFNKKPLLLKYSGNVHALRAAVTIVNLTLSLGLPVGLVIWYEETDGYYTPVKREIMKNISGVIGRDIMLFSAAEIAYDRLESICFRDFSKIETENFAAQDVCFLPLNKPNTSRKAVFVTGEGYFSERGYEVAPFEKRTLLPYANVICGKKGGTIVSDNGGYTYFGNSRENKLTAWANDFTSDAPSELLYLSLEKGKYRLNGGLNAAVAHGLGITETVSSAENFTARAQQYIVCDGGAKVYEVDVASCGGRVRGGLTLSLDLVLGANRDKTYFYYKIENGIAEVVNLQNGNSVYFKVFDGEYADNHEVFPRGNADSFGGSYKVDISDGSCKKYFFVFGGDFDSVANTDLSNIKQLKDESLRYFNTLNPFTIKTDDITMDILFNRSLAYQTVSSRVNGKTSIYQAGGATGFRDILQDILVMPYFDAARAREIILDCAEHVYYEGDVIHWWHGEKHGVRTRISDDRLFLPYAVTEYITKTGDSDILAEEVRYLNSPTLSHTEKDRYENPAYFDKTESLLLHLERIIDSCYRIGENGLLLIDGGDWNDALNNVGTHSAGESVWLTMFYINVLDRLKELYAPTQKLLLLDRIMKLKDAVERTFTGRQYKRLFTADGEWIGDGNSRVASIDLITQAWASLADIGEKTSREIALNSAKNQLLDRETGILKLLTPPFDGVKNYGYIGKYPKGVRENGGQYTHAALWYLLALVKEKRIDEAYEIFKTINPICKCADTERAKAYMGEPYVLSADVYSNDDNLGRAGWSWYTGSAAWCYKLILEGFFGISLVGGNLEIKPSLPQALPSAEIIYRYKNSVYRINLQRNGRSAFYENGVEYKNCNSIKLADNETRNFVINF